MNQVSFRLPEEVSSADRLSHKKKLVGWLTVLCRIGGGVHSLQITHRANLIGFLKIMMNFFVFFSRVIKKYKRDKGNGADDAEGFWRDKFHAGKIGGHF